MKIKSNTLRIRDPFSKINGWAVEIVARSRDGRYADVRLLVPHPAFPVDSLLRVERRFIRST